MSYHKCEFCENESRFVCVRCKKDVCKDHAYYERNQEGGGEWVCPDCHSQNNMIKIIVGVVGFIIMIVFVVIMLSVINNNFPGGIFP